MNVTRIVALAKGLPTPTEAGEAPGAVAQLRDRLVQGRRMIAQALRQAQARAQAAALGGEPPPRLAATTVQLATVDAVAADAQGAAEGAMAQTLSLAQAALRIRLAADTLLNLVNGIWVGAQAQTLGTYGPALEQLSTQRRTALDRYLAVAAGTGTGGLSAAPSAGAGTPAPAVAPSRAACCAYADLAATFRLQQTLAAAEAINMAASIVAVEAVAEVAGADLASAVNASLPASAEGLLASTDVAVLVALGLGSAVTVPVPGAVPEGAGPGLALDPSPGAGADGPLASRCGAFPCDSPVLQARTAATGEFLAGSFMALVSLSLYSVSAHLALAMEAWQGGPAPGPAPLPGNQTAWTEFLERQVQARDQATLTEPTRAPRHGTPGPSGSGGSACPGLGPGMADSQVLGEVLRNHSSTIREDYLPALLEFNRTAVPSASQVAGMLSGIAKSTSAGLEHQDLADPATRTPASQSQWQTYSSLATCAKYAAAVAQGHQAGILDRAAALTLLEDLTDSLQVLVFGWFIEASAVPLEVSLLFQRGALPKLAEARAEALGQAAAGDTGSSRCQAACGLAQLDLQAAAQELGRTATVTNLVAFIEAQVSTAIIQALDTLALIQSAAPNQTRPVAGEAAQEPDGAGTVASVLAASLAPISLGALAAILMEPARSGTLGITPALPPGCPVDACDLGFDRQQLALAEQTKVGSDLTLLIFTLDVAVTAFRIALAAEPGGNG
jgi:hypothetical protein